MLQGGRVVQIQANDLFHGLLQRSCTRPAQIIVMVLNSRQRFTHTHHFIAVLDPLLAELLHELLQIAGALFNSKAGK